MKRRGYGTGQVKRLPSGSYRAVPPASWDLPPKTFRYRQDAADYLARHGARRTLGMQLAEVRGDLRLEDVLPRYLEDLELRGRRESTLAGYRSDCRIVAERWGQVRIDAIDGPFLESIVTDGVQQSWAPSTIRNRLDRVTGALRYAMRRGVTPARPLPVARPAVPVQRRPDPYTEGEVTALLAAARARGPVELASLLVAVDCGLRRGELARLRLEDVDQELRAIHVRVRSSEDRPKSGSGRVVPATHRVLLALAALDGRSRERSALSPTGTSAALTRLLEPVWQAAGLGRVRWHRLRHTWASRMADAGASVWDLQQAAGWSSPTLANRYVHQTRVPGAGLLDAELGTDAACVPRGTGRKSFG